MSSKEICTLCNESLGNKRRSEIVTSCLHSFHTNCVNEYVSNKYSLCCPKCGEQNALKHLINDYSSSYSNKKSLSPLNKESKTEDDDISMDCMHHSPRPAVSYSNKKEDDEWRCDECHYRNDNSDSVCQNCRSGKQPPSTRKHLFHKREKSFSKHSYDEKDYSSSNSPLSDDDHISKFNPPIVQHPVQVYVIDLPFDFSDDHQLENCLRERIEKTQNIQLIKVKCYSRIGVGVIYVSSDAKDHLINVLGKLSWNPKDADMISFADTVDFVSYIVLNVSNEKGDFVLPQPDEIKYQWSATHNGEKPRYCDQLNSEFPNIYRLITTSLEQLIANLDHQEFRIKNYVGRIYYCANCSFFEDLPRSMTTDQLREAIGFAIKTTHFSSNSFYIQPNRQTGNVCVIASNAIRKWSTLSYFELNGKPISKKNRLSCRLLIHPVPHSLSPQTIIRHKIFYEKAMIVKQNSDSLIVEISDKNIYEKCIAQRSVLIADKYKLNLEPYSASNNPDRNEIDRETWYDTEMSKYKPDIMQFIADPTNHIFRYKWNAKIWQEQFENTLSNKFVNDLPLDPRKQRDSDMDIRRHLLQMTVMLNTLASIVRKRYFIKDREFQLNFNKNMKTIIYNHQSKLIRGFKMPIKPPPFLKTSVHVLKDDCVAVYERLLRYCKRPLLLNMASAVTPGGGYRKGDNAQEENIFRRSDYYRSLDAGLDDVKYLPPCSERFRCTNDGRFEPLPKPHTMYPMDEFGAIYTSGITIFRHSQDVGYEYMEKPLENVAAIAMAAYRDPKLDGKLLSSKFAWGTRKKIENMFAIAHHQQHDSIILSAFGCGAFRNPPEHIAQIFASVIQQYAGYFDTIEFAIIDDHNSGQRLNPQGNYKPFMDILDGKTFKPSKSMNKSNTIHGSFRVSYDGTTTKDVCIFEPNVCVYGVGCTKISDNTHVREYIHPPMCSYTSTNAKCDLQDDHVHMSSFIHPKSCQYGGECRNINEAKHVQEYTHPSYCSKGGACQDMDQSHLKEFCHLPLCQDGLKCMEYRKGIPHHCQSHRHCQNICPYGNQCVNFFDKTHTTDLKHLFPPPCPRTPFHCRYHIELSQAMDTTQVSKEAHDHCLEYSHVCRFGRNCKENKELHQNKSIHIIRRVCPYDGKCKRLHQNEHLNSYTHTNIPDIRALCQHTEKCYERHKLDHSTKFRHTRSNEDIGTVHLYNLNFGINFVKNQCNNIKVVLDYIRKHGWQPPSPSNANFQRIFDHFHTVQPVHRCRPFIFESILLHGHVMSRDYMDQLRGAQFVVTSVIQHSRIRRIKKLRIPAYRQEAKQYITEIVSAEFDAADFPPPGPNAKHSPPRLDPDEHKKNIQSHEQFLASTFSSTDLQAMKKTAKEIARASIELHTNPAGIGHPPDKIFGTHKRVFSILGPNLGHYYGDVVIVFKREILHHPDADFSMCAATTFGDSKNAYRFRPWLTDPGIPEKRVDHYHDTKLHASIPGVEYAIALELVLMTSLKMNVKLTDIDLETIFKRWMNIDSHQAIEAHLPQLIPIDYIDHIYLPQNVYDSFNDKILRSLDAVFKNHYTIVKYRGFISEDPMGPAGPLPLNNERSMYQNEVVRALMKRYELNTNQLPSRPIQGAVITIPASEFKENYVLPLAIYQASELYRFENQNKPTGNTAYIYWQTINGDMMLVLAREAMKVMEQSNSPCLLCYISPKPNSHDFDYHEQATYINSGQPIQHYEFVDSHNFKASSNRFHRGSNTDDYITYCLELHYSTGKVILRQAGANAIYNHEEISYQFPKNELDLTQLNYIHITSNDKEVSVRNLFICFKRDADLHPTFDKDFKKPSPIVPPAPPDSDAGHGSNSSPLHPCRDNINCLLQYMNDAQGKAHISKYSHPCRFSELCRNKESHLSHEPHQVPTCKDNQECKKLGDPRHRAEYRHTDLPDFLVPCRLDSKCPDKSIDHLIKYSHGEKVYKSKIAGANGAASVSYDPRPPCKLGTECRDISNGNHRAKYSHEKSDG